MPALVHGPKLYQQLARQYAKRANATLTVIDILQTCKFRLPSSSWQDSWNDRVDLQCQSMMKKVTPDDDMAENYLKLIRTAVV